MQIKSKFFSLVYKIIFKEQNIMTYSPNLLVTKYFIYL